MARMMKRGSWTWGLAAVGIILSWMAFWGVIIYVVAHFVKKLW